MYAGPRKQPHLLPGDTATVPGWASSSDSLSPFCAFSAATIAARRSSGYSISAAARCKRLGIVRIVLVKCGNAVKMVGEIGEQLGGPGQVSVADTGGLHGGERSKCNRCCARRK